SGWSGGVIQSLAFLPDGTALVMASDHHLTIWDPAARKARTEFAHGCRLLALSPDGGLCAGDEFGYPINKGQEIKVYDTATGQERASIKPGYDQNNFLMFRPDGKALATAGYNHSSNKPGSIDMQVKLWDLQTGAEVTAAK